MSETTAHQALASFIKIAAAKLPDLAYVWHTANESAGGAKDKNGVPIDVLREAQMGAVAGVWDWLYIGPNHQPIPSVENFYFGGVAIELKSSKAYRSANHGLTPEQVVWRTHYIRQGWYTAIYPEQDWTDAAELLIRWVGGDIKDFRF